MPALTTRAQPFGFNTFGFHFDNLDAVTMISTIPFAQPRRHFGFTTPIVISPINFRLGAKQRQRGILVADIEHIDELPDRCHGRFRRWRGRRRAGNQRNDNQYHAEHSPNAKVEA